MTLPGQPKKPSFFKALLSGDMTGMYMSGHSRDGKRAPVAKLLHLFSHRTADPRYRTKITNFPPLHWLWRNWTTPKSDAEFLHRAYIRALWKERNWPSRAKLVAHYLLWPLVFSTLCIWATRINGRAVAKRESTSIVQQVIGQCKAAIYFGMMPHWYYIFELHRPSHMAQGDNYLQRFELKGGLYDLMLSTSEKREMLPIGDKILFAEHCTKHGIATPREYFIYHADQPTSGLVFPHEDLFIKPCDSRGGVGAHAWRFENGAYVSLKDNERLDADGLMRRLVEINRTVLVQTRLSNHNAIADLSNGALATVRMMTFANERGEHEVTTAGFRMAVGSNRLVDNVHAGGIIAPVNLATGILGQASNLGIRPDLGWLDHHPQSGGQITGRQLPFWQETMAVARRAHAIFAPRVMVGWDIAITDNGPYIVEGNMAPDTDILQRAHRAPLGGTRFAELVRFHLSRQSETRKLIGED